MLVDLLMSYSKRVDLVSELVSASERLKTTDAHETGDGRSVRSDQALRVWKVADRLTTADLSDLIDLYRAGTTADALAEQFEISKSSVKRLLRVNGVRRVASKPTTCSVNS